MREGVRKWCMGERVRVGVGDKAGSRGSVGDKG